LTRRGPRARRSAVTPRVRHTTVPSTLPPASATRPKLARRPETPKPIARRTSWGTTAAPKHRVARIIDPDEATLLDLIDNLLNQGVVLNAELILGLADVDLVYVRLSALLCAADRVLPPGRS
jgi:Gas vesicle protein